MLGGCCGTTPEHIKAVDDMLKKRAASGLVVREPKPYFGEMRISGLEPLTVDKGLGFMNVGERCNIAGSIKFKKLILNGEYDKALEIARAQAESGAQVIDATHPNPNSNPNPNPNPNPSLSPNQMPLRAGATLNPNPYPNPYPNPIPDQVIDVNMDEGLLDCEYAMKKFLNMLIPEPDISKVPRVIVRDRVTLTLIQSQSC